MYYVKLPMYENVLTACVNLCYPEWQASVMRGEPICMTFAEFQAMKEICSESEIINQDAVQWSLDDIEAAIVANCC